MANFKHGEGKRGQQSTTWLRWQQLRRRLKHKPGYTHLDMDPRWNNYLVFLADMGECPEGYTTERRDNSRGYWPDNCYWLPANQQPKNRNLCVKLTYKGRTQILADWAREVGLIPETLSYRLKRGWSLERALEQPARTPKRG